MVEEMDKDIKILVYDDHHLVTEAIYNYVFPIDGLLVTDRCHTIEAVKTSLCKIVPDVIISDVLSDEDAGLSLFEFISAQYPDVKIVAFTSLTNDFVIESLLQMGVSAVVNKKEKISVLVEVVKSIHHDNKTTSRIKNEFILTLTKKEKEIAEYLAKGFSAKEIAQLSGTSVNTVHNQKNLLLEKYSCTNSTELVVKLAQIGLIKIY